MYGEMQHFSHHSTVGWSSCSELNDIEVLCPYSSFEALDGT